MSRHYWWLASYGKSPKDSYAFWAVLEGRWFRLVGNAAFRGVRRVLNPATVRLVAGDNRYIHRLWLGDIYAWAGESRNVLPTSDAFTFAAPAQIPRPRHPGGDSAGAR